MPTEFDDDQHYGLFKGAGPLRTGNSFEVRMSELTLAALRAAGVFDNMIDGLAPPATNMLWLDKNTDPATLRAWDATGSSWVPMTFDRLFARAAVVPLMVTGGTGNAVIVSQPSSFRSDSLYVITPTAANTGAVTIQVAGVGTYPVTYANGWPLEGDEFVSGRQSVLLFDGTGFRVLFQVSDLNSAVVAAQQAASDAAAASVLAEQAADDAEAAAALATDVITGATSDDTFDDSDQVIYVSGSTIKKGLLTGLVSSIFKLARTIPNAVFASATFAWKNAGGFAASIDTSAHTANRAAYWPDWGLNFGFIPRLAPFTSPPQAPSLGGLLSASHGFGVEPRTFRAYLVCTVADAGFPVGRRIEAKTDSVATADGYGLLVYADTTAVYARVGNVGLGLSLNYTTGARAILTMTSWNVVFHAEAP